MPAGGKVKIYNAVKNDEHRKISHLIISVADNGPGIPSAESEKIFEPFYTTRQTGTGLGLSIVKKRLEKLKGSISVQDNNPGALFQVQLPLAYVDRVQIPENQDPGHAEN